MFVQRFFPSLLLAEKVSSLFIDSFFSSAEIVCLFVVVVSGGGGSWLGRSFVATSSSPRLRLKLQLQRPVLRAQCININVHLSHRTRL